MFCFKLYKKFFRVEINGWNWWGVSEKEKSICLFIYQGIEVKVSEILYFISKLVWNKILRGIIT